MNDLSQLRFLVIDEADRMVQQGGFPQLHSILDAVQRANPMDDDDSDDEEEEDDDMADPDRMLGLPGIPGEARVQMLSDDILRRIEEQRNGAPPEMDDEEEESLEPEPEEEDEEDELSLPPPPPVHRQTFVYSATLTLPSSDSYSKKKRMDGVEGGIAEILEKSRAKGKTKVIDLSFSSNKKESKDRKKSAKDEVQQPKNEARFKLPPGLTLQEIKCTQMHKDSHLYAYLKTTAPDGPCLVFCNSIAGVKRVSSTLQTLNVPVKTLHANRQQVCSLVSSNSWSAVRRNIT